jgi:hypothetical protein
VSSNTFWATYLQLLQEFRNQVDNAAVTQILNEHQEAVQFVDEETVQILPGLRELRNGDNVVGPYGDQYIGGNREPSIPHPVTMDSGDLQSAVEYATFTDEDDSDGF